MRLFLIFFSRTLTIANKIHFREVSIIEKILCSMTSKFDYVACSIEESNNLDIMTIDELQSSLLVHEQRMQRHTVEEQALKITLDSSTRRTNREGAQFEVEDEDIGDQVLTKLLLSDFIVMTLVIFSMNVPRRVRKNNYKLILLKLLNSGFSWHMLKRW